MSKGKYSVRIALVNLPKMRRKIIQYCHPVLRKKALEVKAGEETSKLIEEMKETLKEEGGVGLAASQIGVSKRVILVDTREEYLALLNPEVIKKSNKKVVEKEGCLSMGGVWLKVERSQKVRVRALTERGEDITLDTEGILAVILQHEIDHLNGKLFIDRVGFSKKVRAIISYFFIKIKRVFGA